MRSAPGRSQSSPAFRLRVAGVCIVFASLAACANWPANDDTPADTGELLTNSLPVAAGPHWRPDSSVLHAGSTSRSRNASTTPRSRSWGSATSRCRAAIPPRAREPLPASGGARLGQAGAAGGGAAGRRTDRAPAGQAGDRGKAFPGCSGAGPGHPFRGLDRERTCGHLGARGRLRGRRGSLCRGAPVVLEPSPHRRELHPHARCGGANRRRCPNVRRTSSDVLAR